MGWTVTSTNRGLKIFKVKLLGPKDFGGYEKNHPGRGWELVEYEDGHSAWSGNFHETEKAAREWLEAHAQ